MGCIHSNAKRRIQTMQKQTSSKQIRFSTRLALDKHILKKKNLFVVIEAPESHEVSHDL